MTMPNYYNPYQQYGNQYGQYGNTSQQQNCFFYVNGKEGANSFQMPPNQTVLLMDSDNPIFYMKTSNNLGQSTIKTYRFEEIKDKPVDTKFVSVEDFNALKEQVDKLVKGVGKNEPDISTTNTK